ncbi:MAG: SIR2 family protein [Verrucomicrobiales bacterium]|nr:SIR2 family protein [Verrucomicrobiales bacterium]
MPEDKIQRLTEQEAVDQIVKTVKRAETGSAPFALVLGSGFSHGLVPTTRELVEESLPLWMRSQNDGKPYEEFKALNPGDRADIAREFWSSFVASNRGRGCDLELDSQTGIPKDIPAAYKAAFSSSYFNAVGEPANARRLQRALMRLDQPRLNAAHFLLASLLGVQPGKQRKSDLFKARAAFCRLILTTNFDPFIQTALQAVNRLYFMSDTPNLGISDEILDDQTDAIHLVYVHGSIHRRSQAASEEEIQKINENNTHTLAPVLKRRGVIVLGYSGWDDAIVEALAACDLFDHRLYWCGREQDPLAKGAFGAKVPDILRKPATHYVTIETAGSFMAKLCNGLVNGLPRLLSNPIGQLCDLLEAIDLKELDYKAKLQTSEAASLSVLTDPLTPSQNFFSVKELTLKRLREAEHRFFGPVSLSVHASTSQDPAKTFNEEESQKKFEQLVASAKLASGLGNHLEALRLCNQALTLKDLAASAKIDVWMLQGLEHFHLGQLEAASTTWGRVIDLPNTPVDIIAKALVNRGVSRGRRGEPEKEIADYTRVIEKLTNASADLIAQAFVNRGVTLGHNGELEKALADYTHVIEHLPGVSEDLLAQAVFNRGVTYGRARQIDRALADYSRVAEKLSGASADLIAKALINRGVYCSRNGEIDKANTDYTHVIERLSGTPQNLIAQALAKRGWTHFLGGDYPQFLSDTEAALSRDPKLDFAAFNLGLALLSCGHDARALDAYRHAGEAFPEFIDSLGLPDLIEAQKAWLTAERAAPVVGLLQSLKK